MIAKFFCRSTATLISTLLITTYFLTLSLKTSAATLIIGDNLVLKSVNDKPLDSGFFSSQRQVDITEGEQVLLIKYKDVFEDLDFAEDRLVESDYFIVKFTLVNEKKLLLATPKIKNLAAAERFSHTPELTLTDEKNKSLVLNLATYDDFKLEQQVNKAVDTLTNEGVVPLLANKSSLQSNTSQSAYTSPEASVQATIVTSGNEISEENHETQAFNHKVVEHIDTLPMLKYWWEKASKAEKQKFIQFINSQ